MDNLIIVQDKKALDSFPKNLLQPLRHDLRHILDLNVSAICLGCVVHHR